MTSQTLRDTRRYEEAMAQNITDQERPEFHLSPKVGWMNDPNGFSYYKDKFHLYYQYYPYDSQWGPMHWGHVVSDDLLHWEYLPSAIAPDMPYDYVGCFSGSAIELPDGKQLFMYTGVRKEVQPGGGVRDIQTQFNVILLQTVQILFQPLDLQHHMICIKGIGIIFPFSLEFHIQDIIRNRPFLQLLHF